MAQHFAGLEVDSQNGVVPAQMVHSNVYRRRSPGRPRRRATPRDGTETTLRPAKRRQLTRALPRNQRAQSLVHEGRLLLHTGDTARFFNQVVRSCAGASGCGEELQIDLDRMWDHRQVLGGNGLELVSSFPTRRR